MEGFANFAFALFAMLLMAGSLFADGNGTATGNLPPVITGTGGPTTVVAGQAGTWSVSAYDPESGPLVYSVYWGDSNSSVQVSPSSSNPTATFQHTYSSSGAYTVTFTVADGSGASTQSTITTDVTGPSSPVVLGKIAYWWGKVNMHYANGEWVSDTDATSGANLEMRSYCNKWFPGTTEIQDSGVETINGWKNQGGFGSFSSVKPTYLCVASSLPGSAYGTVLASPSGVYQDDIVSVYGTVTNNGGSTETFKSVLSFAGENPAASNDALQTAYPAQEIGEVDVSIAPGETRSLSVAHFAAKTLDYNFAKISVYLKVGDSYKLVSQKLDRVTVSRKTAGNMPPVITGTSGPSSIAVNQQGIWSVSAYDPDGAYLAYSVNWGETSVTPAYAKSSGSTATFQHTYSSAGTYTITFTVADNAGQSTQSTKTVAVGPGAIPSVDLKVNGMDNPDAVQYNSTFTVSWASNGASCMPSGHHVLLPNGSAWTDFSTLPSSGSMTLLAAHKNYGYVTPLQLGIQCFLGAQDAADQVSVPVTQPTSSNRPPVITSVSGPYSLDAGKAGTWKVSAYDPDGSYLAYYVNWGEGGTTPVSSDSLGRIGSSASFEHTYVAAGAYTITFSVKDGKDATTLSTLTVNVGSASSSALSISGVWTEPDPLNKGDSVIYAKVMRGNVPANPASTKVQFTLGYPDGRTETDNVGLNAQNSAYINSGYYGMGFGNGVLCGSYRITVAAKTDDGLAASKSSSFTLFTPYCTETAVNGEVIASVSPTPLEVAQYGKVRILGKVSRASGASSDAGQAYKVVLSLDNRNAIAQETAASANEKAAAAGSASVAGSANSQATERYITLGAGESTEVSADFTAKSLGTNFAKIAVYRETSACSASQGDADSESAAARPCKIIYQLVASDTAKVKVTNGGSQPGEPVKMALYPGWNMISNPKASNLQLGDIAAKCSVASNAWAYDPQSNSYVQASTLYGGMGYWLFSNELCSFEVASPYVEKMSIGLNAGWNMIGATGATVLLSSVSGNCKITSGPWLYSPGAAQYYKSTTLEPAKAYWVKVASACTLEAGSPSITPPVPPGE